MSAKVAALPSAPNGLSNAHDINWALDDKMGVGTCKSSAPVFRSPKSKQKAHDESLLKSLSATICDNQIGISVNLVLLLFLTHVFFPRARRRTTKFFHLSYYNPETDMYGCGTEDLAYLALGVVIFTGLRVFVMEYILDPIARFNGIKSKKGLVRFKEQAWLVCYCTCSWSLGMYLMYHSEFWFNLNGMWKGWPFREVTGLHKFYYLIQWAFYIQQIIVVNIEEKRKDYAQMFTHHIFTSALIFLSYGYYHMRVGTVILCIMDLVDIVLPSAKLLKYMGYTTACDIAFGLFVVVWFITRHVFYPMVYWSVYAHTPTAMAPGCYLSDGTMYPPSTPEFEALGGNDIWGNILKAYDDRTGPICWNPTIRFSFLSLLLALQAIICLWFYTICKIVYKVLSGQNADDDRSDDEGDDLDVDIDEEIANGAHTVNGIKSSLDYAPIEEEVGVEDLNYTRKSVSPGVRNYRTRSTRSSGSRASGLSIPGHGDHKELLGRIGCDKPS